MRHSIPPWRALLVFAAALVIIVDGSFALAAPPASQTAFVRVNQVGYTTADSKRAYLLASAAETGATFSVNSGSDHRFSGPIGANLGSWSSAYPNVYALDFSSVATAGTYTISVAGPITATSPSFRIDAGQNVYAQALANSLSFFQVQRDGPAFIPSALRTAARAPERPDGHDLSDAQLQRRLGTLQRRSVSAGRHRGRVRRLVRRG